jgi:hypothetical protein
MSTTDIIKDKFIAQFSSLFTQEILPESRLLADFGSDNFVSSQGHDVILAVPKNEKGELSLMEGSGSDVNSWIYFLNYGKLPWWYSEEKAKETFAWEKMKPKFRKYLETGELLTKFQYPPFFERLVTQYSGRDLEELIWMVIAGKTPIQKSQYRKAIESVQQDHRLVFFRAVLSFSIFLHLDNSREQTKTLFFSTLSPEERKIVKEIFREVIKFNDIKDRKNDIREFIQLLDKKTQSIKEVQKDIRKNNREISGYEENEDVGFYISRSGLILLHPFLKAFFNDCGWLDDGGRLVNAEMAVHALYYLGTKKEHPFDFEVVFEKYLLGMRLDQPLEREVLLSREIKDKTAKLLHALKDNWASLGSTGIETIRNEFINRKGKLVLEDNNDRLFVERKTQDILLGGISYNFSLIKLPWHKKYLLVDW